MKNSIRLLLASLFIFASPLIAQAKPQSAVTEKTIEYKEGDTVLEGFIASPKNLKPSTPIIVVVHEWMGLGTYAKARARMLAEQGYIAFAADIYGKGVRAKDMDEAAKLSTIYKSNRPLMRKRISAAIAEAAKIKNGDSKKIAVIGYCFGGTVALEAARSHEPVVAAVSFHGGLSSPLSAETHDLKAKVLVLHGGDDPFVKDEEVKAFEDEMKRAKADWQVFSYGGAVHSFTNWETPFKEGSPMGYNESADKRSWVAMKSFFDEVLKR